MRLIAAMRTSPALAGMLSFLWPGLGQGLVGASRRGWLLALPALALAAALGLLLAAGSRSLLAIALSPTALLVLIGLNLLLLAYRAFAIVDAYRLAGRRVSGSRLPGRIGSHIVLVVLLGGVVAMHGWVGYIGWSAYDTLITVFSDHGPRGAAFGGDPTATPRPSPTAHPMSAATAAPSPTPEPTPTPVPDWAADGRLDVILIGADAGPGRWKLRTDTMILVSVEIETGRAALFGIPRNLVNVPLPPPTAHLFDCRCFPEMLNALWVHADEHPELFPGGDNRGFAAIEGAISELTGIQIDGMALAELQGFVQLVDAIDGIDIDVPFAVYDDRYPKPDGTGNVELYIAAGQQHLDGWHALAYARTRHQDSDYARMERQQLVLLALRRQVACDLLGSLPELMRVARDTLWTNLPLDDLPELVEVARSVDTTQLERYAFTPPTYPEHLDPEAVERIRALVRDVFEGPAPSPGETPAPDDAAGGC